MQVSFLGAFGLMILQIVYGKEKMKTLPMLSILSLVLSLLFVFWMLSLFFLFTGSASEDFFSAVLYAITFPVAILIWSIIARRK